jgi:acetylcholinesterase
MLLLFGLLITLVASSSAKPLLSKTSSTSTEQVPVATVRNGCYYGTHSSTYNQDFFLGIPFAQPPLELLRFANPQSLNWTWSGALPATNYAYVSP